MNNVNLTNENLEFSKKKCGFYEQKGGFLFAISWDFCNNDEDMKPKNSGVNPVEY